MGERVLLDDLVGKVITELKLKEGTECATFTCSDGSKYVMEHRQDCCEFVRILEVVGDPEDLLDSPVLLTGTVQSTGYRGDEDCPPETDESYTWTFYRIGTIKGTVTIRWFGTSNGYYSEEVDFVKL